MELRIPWREYRDLEKLIKSQKLVDQYVADQIEKMADENARYYFFLDLNKVTGDLTNFKNWILLAKPEWIYVDPVSVQSFINSTNFVGARPSYPVAGMVYYDIHTGTIKMYDGTQWLDVS